MKFYHTPWRPNHLQDVLCQMHSGQWYGFNGEQTYDNLVIHGDYPKPTQEYLESELARFQAEYDAQEYARKRKLHYPEIGDQLDSLYHAGVFPKEMADKLKSVKDAHPKGAS